MNYQIATEKTEQHAHKDYWTEMKIEERMKPRMS